MRDLVTDLALALRERVRPFLGQHAGRVHERGGHGGDITFAIDGEAERLMERFLTDRAPDVAFYSEDRGLVTPGAAEWVLIVDPIDGTRPAMAGLESACVSVAAAPLNPHKSLPASPRASAAWLEGLGSGSGPTFSDVRIGVICEIKSGQVFVAERGRSLEPPPRLSANTEIERMLWTYGLRGRPARPMAEVLGDLIDASSVGGASFDLGSATFDMTRIATGQLDAYIEPGPRIVADVPTMKEEFERVGKGAVLNNSPYDLAAAVLCLEEAGAVVTDAYGHPLDDRPLLGSGVGYQVSCVAAANRELHAAICEALDAGIARLRESRSRSRRSPR